MFFRVIEILEVERRDPRLEEAPKRLSEVGRDAHEMKMGEVGVTGLSSVEADDGLAARVVKLLIDGEVSEIEVGVSHSGVLPIEHPDALVRLISESVDDFVALAPD